MLFWTKLQCLMNDDNAAQLGSSTTALTRIRDKRKKEEIRKMVAGDEPPHLRLRAALASGLKPPHDLLEMAIIGQALSLDDCFTKVFSRSFPRRRASSKPAES